MLNTTQSFIEPCIGSGALALPVSNYTCNMRGQDIAIDMINACLFNSALYMPWMFLVPNNFTGFSPESIEQRNKSVKVFFNLLTEGLKSKGLMDYTVEQLCQSFVAQKVPEKTEPIIELISIPSIQQLSMFDVSAYQVEYRKERKMNSRTGSTKKNITQPTIFIS